MYNGKTFNMKNHRDMYVPDDLEQINDIIDGLDDETSYGNEEYDALFKTLNETIYNQREIENSTNYKVMTEYLSKLKKTTDGKKTDDKTRLHIVNELLKDDSHFVYLTETFFNCGKRDRYRLLGKFVEYPLECMSSYIQGTTNSESYLRRKYFDGQTRKRKDGTTYKRKININTEADLIYVDEEGKEQSPIDNAETTDMYFDNADDLVSSLNEKEKEVARLLLYLSSENKPATLKELEKYSNYKKRQLETIKQKLKYKTLLWLRDVGATDTYSRYYDLCTKYKGFEENYKKFLESVKK